MLDAEPPEARFAENRSCLRGFQIALPIAAYSDELTGMFPQLSHGTAWSVKAASDPKAAVTRFQVAPAIREINSPDCQYGNPCRQHGSQCAHIAWGKGIDRKQLEKRRAGADRPKPFRRGCEARHGYQIAAQTRLDNALVRVRRDHDLATRIKYSLYVAGRNNRACANHGGIPKGVSQDPDTVVRIRGVERDFQYADARCDELSAHLVHF